MISLSTQKYNLWERLGINKFKFEVFFSITKNLPVIDLSFSNNNNNFLRIFMLKKLMRMSRFISQFYKFEMKKKSIWMASNKKIVKNVKGKKVNIKKIR